MWEILTKFLTIAAGTFVSEDLTSITAGTLAGRGEIGIWFAIAACFAGIYTGDVLLYLTGRIFGRRAIALPPLKWIISESVLTRASGWLSDNGMAAVFLSRLTPGLRLPVYFSAGMLRTNGWRFALFFALAAAVWTPVIVGAAAYLSKGLMGMPMFAGSVWIGLIATVLLVFVVFNVLLRLATWRGRRELVGFWRRWTRWEFWPLQLFYLPVFLYVLVLGVRYRSLSVFADANPEIPRGGLVGESKAAIYAGLAHSASASPLSLSFKLLPSDQSEKRIKSAVDFIKASGLNFPVVIKPDAGERGKGVVIARSQAELFGEMEERREDLILQEYAGGDEFSVFYYRNPDEERGRIFSITEKRFPSVLGDGVSNFERLILNDARAVAIATKYLERNADRLTFVPAAGEKVQIVDIGTHSRGAIFLDGWYARTEELETAIDQVCRGFNGFYFGRFDLRTNSMEELRAGKFKIVELNGVASESTNIYDPKFSLIDAYGILFKQWSIAFEIGRRNRELRGARTTTRDLIGHLAAHYLKRNKKISRNTEFILES